MRQLSAILLLPAMAVVVIPVVILLLPDTASYSLLLASSGVPFWLRIIAGAVSVILGLAFMAMTNLLFAKIGKGTLAPWDPPQKLVVRGIYRHVRNPMITGVLLILLGESLLADSLPLFCWFLTFAIANFIYLPVFEEPKLTIRFGEDYSVYKRNVPRWIPRLKPWDPENSDKS